MVLRKTATDNSVSYIPEKEQTKEKTLNQKQQKLVHFLVNKSKFFHKTLKKLSKILQQEDLEYLNE